MKQTLKYFQRSTRTNSKWKAPLARYHSITNRKRNQQWRELLDDKVIKDTEAFLTEEQKNLLVERVDSEKFLKESQEFRKKALFLVQLLQAKAEKTLTYNWKSFLWEKNAF